MTREKLDLVLSTAMQERARDFVSYPKSLPPEAIDRILAVGDEPEAIITAITRELRAVESGLEFKGRCRAS
jgi:hypothetical protein